MVKSIVILITLICACIGIYSALVNFIRIKELRDLNRRIDRFEKSFNEFKKIESKMTAKKQHGEQKARQ